ncbi:MAG: tetratricopeptide repeat protein [Myxococcales bacterium]|nr:tetratricopeptide repeat protein [Myxococcales bacterium]
MTAHRDLKRIIRDRQAKTGESYTAARVHVMRERATLLGLHDDAGESASSPVRADAAVLKVNQQSARVRILGEEGQITFRSRDAREVVPGHLVTLVIEKRWTWRGDAYAAGRVENLRIAVDKLGLVPLPLEGGDLQDLRSAYEPYRSPDPYAPLWRKLTAKPRAWFEMDPIAWGAFPGRDDDEDLTCDAADLAAAGDHEGARELLMDLLGTDVRCIDAHAHLGNLEFDRSATRAMIHYEIGIRIGELSLPPGFDGVLVWGRIYNRPFLRCLHGYGLCLWRLGRLAEAEQVFERILSLNPNDNQGVRWCWDDVRHGRGWEEMWAHEVAVGAKHRESLH